MQLLLVNIANQEQKENRPVGRPVNIGGFCQSIANDHSKYSRKYSHKKAPMITPGLCCFFAKGD